MKKIMFMMLAALFAITVVGAAHAVTSHVANTSKVASMIVFPKVEQDTDFDPLFGAAVAYNKDTLIAIGNNANEDVLVECIWSWPTLALSSEIYDALRDDYYRVWQQTCCTQENFTFTLTANQVRYFSAGLGIGDILAGGLFTPINKFAGNRGSLTCFAIEEGQNGLKKPIAWNHLYGTAEIFSIVIDETFLGIDIPFAFSTWKYNAWGFEALANRGTVMKSGDPNDPYKLLLTGYKGAYDACPDLLTFSFIANIENSAQQGGSPPLLGGPFVATDLTLTPCHQDLRERTTTADPKVDTRTVADFQIYNQNEVGYSGTRACIKCWWENILGVTSVGRQYWDDTLNAWVTTTTYPTPSGVVTDNYGFRFPRMSDVFQMEQGDNFVFFPPQGGIGTLAGRARVNGVADTMPSVWCTSGTVGTPLIGEHFAGFIFDEWYPSAPPLNELTALVTAGAGLTGIRTQRVLDGSGAPVTVRWTNQ